MSKNRAFVKYTKSGNIIPGSLIVTTNGGYPNNGTYKEVPSNLCCDVEYVPSCVENWSYNNLDVTTFRNGDSIPEVTNTAAWNSLTTPAWCYYNNSTTNGTIYGKLYNRYALNDPRGLAPEGWRIPTIADWQTLISCLGGDLLFSSKVKSEGNLIDHTGLWSVEGGTNETGLAILPGGAREGGVFGYFSTHGMYHAIHDTALALNGIAIRGDGFGAYNFFGLDDTQGCYVRCIKDI